MLGNPERGTRQIRIRMPSADKVEIMGDFTGWAPVALQSEGNEWWSVRLPVKPGIHELNVRFNGGEWTVPRGMEKKSDEFGGAVGVFVVQL
jgi:1,4-alpha-glucan branching enzyme